MNRTTAAAKTHAPLQLLVANGDFYTTASVAAYTGNRYPHLERIAGKLDLLARIYAPKTFTPPIFPPTMGSLELP